MKFLKLTPTILVLLLIACSTGKAQANSAPPVVTQHAATPAAPSAASSGYAAAPKMTPGVSDIYSVSSVTVDQPVIAMTFDDGPHATLTPKLLDLLKERNIKATFFMVGECAEANPDIVKRIHDEGHEVANHSWNHPSLTKLSPDAVASQLNKTSDAIAAACGVRPVLMRPPYGAVNEPLKKRINEEFKMKVVLWSVDPLDWKRPGPSAVTSRIVSQTQPGAIILSHDIHAGTIEAMPATLDQLKAKGYKFVTVSELLAMAKPNPPKPVATPQAAHPTKSKDAPTTKDLIKAPVSDSSPVPMHQ